MNNEAKDVVNNGVNKRANNGVNKGWLKTEVSKKGMETRKQLKLGVNIWVNKRVKNIVFSCMKKTIILQ